MADGDDCARFVLFGQDFASCGALLYFVAGTEMRVGVIAHQHAQAFPCCGAVDHSKGCPKQRQFFFDAGTAVAMLEQLGQVRGVEFAFLRQHRAKRVDLAQNLDVRATGQALGNQGSTGAGEMVDQPDRLFSCFFLALDKLFASLQQAWQGLRSMVLVGLVPEARLPKKAKGLGDGLGNFARYVLDQRAHVLH